MVKDMLKDEKELKWIKEIRNKLAEVEYIEVKAEHQVIAEYEDRYEVDLIERDNFRVYFDKRHHGFKFETTWSNQSVSPIWIGIVNEIYEILQDDILL